MQSQQGDQGNQKAGGNPAQAKYSRIGGLWKDKTQQGTPVLSGSVNLPQGVESVTFRNGDRIRIWPNYQKTSERSPDYSLTHVSRDEIERARAARQEAAQGEHGSDPFDSHFQPGGNIGQPHGPQTGHQQHTQPATRPANDYRQPSLNPAEAAPAQTPPPAMDRYGNAGAGPAPIGPTAGEGHATDPSRLRGNPINDGRGQQPAPNEDWQEHDDQIPF